MLPVSLVLLMRTDEYADGLTAFRHDGPPDGEAVAAGVTAWVGTFVDAGLVAGERARQARDVATGAGPAELAAAPAVLRRRRPDRGTQGYLADDVFELLTLTERALARTHWDTR